MKARQLERQLKEAEQTLQRLDMEARSAPAPESNELVKKVKGYRKDWQKLMGDVRRVIQQAASAEDRAELGLADEYYQTSAGQRERLLTSTEQLNKTSEKIHEGRRQLLETEVCVNDEDVLNVSTPLFYYYWHCWRVYRRLGQGLSLTCNVRENLWRNRGVGLMM